jgi:hypothetical protein
MILSLEFKNVLLLLAKRVNSKSTKWRTPTISIEGKPAWHCCICNKELLVSSKESVNHAEFHLKEHNLLPFI